MGLGGYLMWTAAGREISKRTNLKVLPVESHGPAVRFIESEVFYNNPYFIQSGEKFEYAFPLILNNPQTNYCKEDTPERAIHRYDKHVIEQICEIYGVQDPELKCDIFLTDAEQNSVEDILTSMIKDDYIVIEPNSKTNYTPNRMYPFDKWQEVVNELSKHISVVQVGQRTDKKLNNCIDLTGATTFREAAAVIKKASAYIGSEGGLMHVANAVDTRSVIIVTGYQSPVMTCYPKNSNIWINDGHGPCGKKTLCKSCFNSVSNHDSKEIINEAMNILGL